MKRIVVENISKKFKIGFKKNQSALERFISLFSGREPKKTLWALTEVSFSSDAGEIVGIIGENGSGKSTLLRIVAGIYSKDTGRIGINGRLIPLIGLNLGLKDRLTMRDNIYLCCSLYGLSQRAVKQRFNLIVKFAELENFVNTKIYQLSTGMLQRFVFSMAIHCNPEILLLDEIFEVGDKNFKKKSGEKIKELVKNGTTVLLVSHDVWMIERYCDRVIWMEQGKIIKRDSTKEILKEYLKQ